MNNSKRKHFSSQVRNKKRFLHPVMKVKNFWQLDTFIKSLTVSERKVLYNIIEKSLYYKRYCPSQTTIGSQAAISREHANRIIYKLWSAGLIRVHDPDAWDGRVTCLYFISELLLQPQWAYVLFANGCARPFMQFVATRPTITIQDHTRDTYISYVGERWPYGWASEAHSGPQFIKKSLNRTNNGECCVMCDATSVSLA
jgi:hypothetical protein